MHIQMTRELLDTLDIVATAQMALRATIESLGHTYALDETADRLDAARRLLTWQMQDEECA